MRTRRNTRRPPGSPTRPASTPRRTRVATRSRSRSTRSAAAGRSFASRAGISGATATTRAAPARGRERGRLLADRGARRCRVTASAEHFVFSPDASQVAFGFSTTTEPPQVWVHDFALRRVAQAHRARPRRGWRRAVAPPLRELRRRVDPRLPLRAGGRRAVPGRRHRPRRAREPVAAVVLVAASVR